MASLEELQRAMAANKSATQRLEGLDEDFDRAEQLRDAPFPERGRRGYVSPLSAFATVLRRKRGYRQMEKVRPVREAARKHLGETEGAIEGDTLRRTLAAEQRAQNVDIRAQQGLDIEQAEEARRATEFGPEQERLASQELRDATAAEEATAKHVRLMNRKGLARPYKRADGSQITVVPDPEGIPKWVQGDQLLDLPTDAYPRGTNYGARGKAMSAKQVGEMSEQITQSAHLSEVAGAFEDRFAQPVGMPTGLAQRVGMAASANDVLDLVDENMDQETKDAMQWWSDWKMLYTLPQRNAAFGATLSQREQAEWLAAENMRPGMDPVEIERRVNRLTEIVRTKMLDEANIGSLDEYNGKFWDAGLANYPELYEKKNGRWVYKGDGDKKSEPNKDFAPMGSPVPQDFSAQEKEEFEKLPPEMQKRLLDEEAIKGRSLPKSSKKRPKPAQKRSGLPKTTKKDTRTLEEINKSNAARARRVDDLRRRREGLDVLHEENLGR